MSYHVHLFLIVWNHVYIVESPVAALWSITAQYTCLEMLCQCLYLPLDVCTLIRKHFELWAEFSFALWQSDYFLIIACIVFSSLLHVNILHLLGCVCFWLSFVPHNPVPSILHLMVCLALWKYCYDDECPYVIEHETEVSKLSVHEADKRCFSIIMSSILLL